MSYTVYKLITPANIIDSDSDLTYKITYNFNEYIQDNIEENMTPNSQEGTSSWTLIDSGFSDFKIIINRKSKLKNHNKSKNIIKI